MLLDQPSNIQEHRFGPLECGGGFRVLLLLQLVFSVPHVGTGQQDLHRQRVVGLLRCPGCASREQGKLAAHDQAFVALFHFVPDLECRLVFRDRVGKFPLLLQYHSMKPDRRRQGCAAFEQELVLDRPLEEHGAFGLGQTQRALLAILLGVGQVAPAGVVPVGQPIERAGERKQDLLECRHVEPQIAHLVGLVELVEIGIDELQ